MDSIRLSLCIPTYNRVNYLRELVPLLCAELAVVNQASIQVELLISDNASTDETAAFLKGLSCPGLKIYRNANNIGGDRNFLACVERASGEYVWLFGDDEMIEPGGIGRLLNLLAEEHPILVILRDAKQGPAIPEDFAYPDYGACVRAEMNKNGSFALSHTLITSNVFRKDVFDQKFAPTMLYTNYAHMYGLINGLRRGGRVVLKSGIFRTRPQRAQFDHWPTALCVKQAGYLWRLAGWFNVPGLRRSACRLASLLPVEILACCLHKIFPKRFGRT
jgi:glycosyltransferase involved in cell wall biosynthesis